MKILEKSNLKQFLKNLSKKYELIAPVKERNTKFQVIEKGNFDKIFLEKITEVPVKSFFIPENETLLSFGKAENNGHERKKIIFGLRNCDLNAIHILDRVMHDTNYLEKRKNTILIGLYCENPDEYCFCNSMELEECEKVSDLFFYGKGKKYFISVNSKSGEEIVKNLKESREKIKLKEINKKELKNKDIKKHYKNHVWESDAAKCLSCSACTVYCPTCNCFNIEDKTEINLKDGERIRQQASCQLKSFSKVAGGKVFRDSRLARFKHFIYHKLVYFKDQHNRYMCVGCGRCLRACPTKIDWVNTINLLIDDKRMKKR
jgi:Pyruvate/2-oxoacid:ferredoxin oxidoreductase delta subunit